MSTEPTTVDRVESAADITLTISTGLAQNEALGGPETSSGTAESMRIPVSRLDRTKDVEISEIREGTLRANGYAVTSISYSGSMMFKGERVRGPDQRPVHIEDLLFDDEGVPVPVTLTITHELSGKSETLQDVLVTSDAYEVESESETETSFDWIAMDEDTQYNSA